MDKILHVNLIEDTTIYRDLFNVDDYLDAIRLGMELAREGYTSIEVRDRDNEET